MKLSIADQFMPERVLCQFDGPTIFTVRDTDGDLLLVYKCGEDEETAEGYFIIAPFGDERLADLTEGRIPILEALSQPWTWLAKGNPGAIPSIQGCSLRELPNGLFLPLHSVMLWPSLEPLISMRQIGEGLTKGEIPALVARQGILGPSAALSGIAEYIEDTDPTMAEAIAPLKEAKVQRIAYASFDIGLSVNTSKLAADSEPMKEAKRLLSAALNAAAEADKEKPLGNYFRSDDEGRAMLKAILNLAPMAGSGVTSTRVSGRLISGGRGVGLSPESRRYLQERSRMPQSQPEMFSSFTGRIGEVDRDKGTFILRDMPGGDDGKVIRFGYDHEEDVLRLFELGYRVEIDARLRPNRSLGLLAIKELGPAAAPPSGPRRKR